MRMNQVSFGKQPDIVQPHDLQKVQQLKQVVDRVDAIVHDLDGVGNTTTIEEKIAKARLKIGRLRVETKKWDNCPESRKRKLDKLNHYENELKQLAAAQEAVSDAIDNDKGGLILPESMKKRENGGLIIDPLEVLGNYNRLPKDPSEALRVMKGKQKVASSNIPSLSVIKNGLKPLENDKWDYQKFNAKDCKLFTNLQGVILSKGYEQEISRQLEVINTKLKELKEDKVKDLPKLGMKVYDPETTGKILVLETAKLRRTALSESLIMPGVHDNLDKPDIVLQPIPDGAPIPFKLDNRFVPKNNEIKEILATNKEYGPILKKQFPEGLPVFIVPGYMDGKLGDIEGGMSIPGHPEAGVWLNSYDNEGRYEYTSMLEGNMASMRGVKKLVPSVLKGNKDRGRALAHEIGHVVSYSLMEKPDNSSSDIILLGSESGGLDFFSVWQAIRAGSRYNNDEKSKFSMRGYSADDKANISLFVDYEAVAEDIRMAITGKQLPASSKMTGIYDQTEEGIKHQQKVQSFIQKVLIEEQDPAMLMVEFMKAA